MPQRLQNSKTHQVYSVPYYETPEKSGIKQNLVYL